MITAFLGFMNTKYRVLALYRCAACDRSNTTCYTPTQQERHQPALPANHRGDAVRMGFDVRTSEVQRNASRALQQRFIAIAPQIHLTQRLITRDFCDTVTLLLKDYAHRSHFLISSMGLRNKKAAGMLLATAVTLRWCLRTNLVAN